jgi:hypothetical protein
LTEDEARALGHSLPPELARVLDQAGYDGDFDAAEFYERARRRDDAPIGVARERVDVALRALGDCLPADERARLLRVLPEAIGRQLVPPDYGAPPEHRARPHAPVVNTLAHGRPGSLHPVAESAPARGQTHSVAANDDPHGETKLSSARGMTQERWRESLATGHPPAERPIAEASDDEE